MKRNKHILINLTDPEYKAIQLLAEKERRKIADYVYLKLIDSLSLDIAQLLRIGEGDFKKANFSDIKAE